MEIVFLWLLFASLVGVWAAKLNRSGLGWFFLAVIISPLIAALFLLVSGEAGDLCGACRGVVSRDATACKHCGRSLRPYPDPDAGDHKDQA